MTSKQRQSKVRKVMKEFKAGTLKSSSGEPVKNRQQAIAIAMSEAGMSRGSKSDAYWDAYVLQVEKEEPEEEECDANCEMDENPAEARCKGYLASLRKKAKK
jgi:hypothetical protein